MDRRVRNLTHLAKPAKPLTDRAAFDRLAPGNYHRIARASGLSLQHVSRVLRGIRGANLSTANRIAMAAGVTLDQLQAYRALGGDNASAA